MSRGRDGVRYRRGVLGETRLPRRKHRLAEVKIGGCIANMCAKYTEQFHDNDSGCACESLLRKQIWARRNGSERNLLWSSLPVFAQNHSPETHSLFQYKLPWESSGTILVSHTEQGIASGRAANIALDEYGAMPIAKAGSFIRRESTSKNTT